MAIYDNDIVQNPDFIRAQYEDQGSSVVLVPENFGSSAIVSINSAAGPVVTLSPGTTGLTYTTGGSTITLAGTLVVANGGTGSTTAAGARSNLGAAASGANSDITGLSTLTGSVIFNAAGSALKVREVSNSFMGADVLVGGTVTVNNTRVTVDSRIFLTAQDNSGDVGSVSISARVAGTSFTISSTSVTDTSTIAWLIIEPA